MRARASVDSSIGSTHRCVFIQPFKRNRATPICVVFENDVFDIELRLRELIRVLHRIGVCRSTSRPPTSPPSAAVANFASRRSDSGHK